MGNLKKRELAVGTFFLVVGLGYLFLTTLLPRKAFIDAAFVPYVLAITMCLLGAMQLWQASKLPASEGSAAKDTADYRTVAKTLGLIIAYAALLDAIGFPIMTVVYLFIQFIVLTPADKKVNYLLYAVIAIATSATVYLTFRYAFDMILPVGLLNSLIE
jgi:putative tricarboxylic transport membrane protein